MLVTKTKTMTMKMITKIKVLLVTLVMLPAINLSGQATMADLYEAFNMGVQSMNTNPAFAITSFEKVIEIADQLGTDDAKERKQQVIAQIPALHYNLARILTQRNDLDGAIDELRKCIAVSEKYNNERYPPLARGMIAVIYTAKGHSARNADDFTQALANFDMAHNYDSTNVRMHLGRVLVYEAQENRDKMLASARAGLIAGADDADEVDNLENIKRTVRISFFNAAQKTMQDSDFAQTERHLLTSIEFGNETATVFYQLGLARFRMDQYQKAIEAFDESLELEEGGNEEKAKVWFHIGRSYEALDNKPKACDAYKKALFGEFAEAARFQIDNVLKCDI